MAKDLFWSSWVAIGIAIFFFGLMEGPWWWIIAGLSVAGCGTLKLFELNK